ncbi:helix-turn-helix domain-containing protein [Erwinia sp. V71]|uniref:helix-turn-helix domain-containing protein n=1 Tax=Erwinia sp. V71 TaxID=3369424 RepID=UPI003F634DFB
MYNALESQKCTTNGTIKSDWHRADVIAALKKKGVSLAALSRGVGLNSRTLNNALERRYPKGERIIAAAIGVEPSEIWPSRYAGVQ